MSVELNMAALEAVSGGRRTSINTVKQSNYSSISMKNMFIDADTKGLLNSGGFTISVVQKNKN